MGRISCPVIQLAPQLIEGSCALAETEEVLAVLDMFSTGDTTWLRFSSLPLHTLLIGTEWFPLNICKGEPSSVAIDPHCERCRFQQKLSARLLNLERCFTEIFISSGDCPRAARFECPVRCQPHPNDSVCQNCDRDTWTSVFEHEGTPFTHKGVQGSKAVERCGHSGHLRQ